MIAIIPDLEDAVMLKHGSIGRDRHTMRHLRCGDGFELNRPRPSTHNCRREDREKCPAWHHAKSIGGCFLCQSVACSNACATRNGAPSSYNRPVKMMLCGALS